MHVKFIRTIMQWLAAKQPGESVLNYTDMAEYVTLPDLQEMEAVRILLLQAYDYGTINYEEFLLFSFALDEEEKQGRQKRLLTPPRSFRFGCA